MTGWQEGMQAIDRVLERYGSCPIRDFDTIPMVRVAESSVPLIKQAPDLRAEGIVAPMVRSAEQARRAVAAIKYPPMGERGMGGP